VIQQHEANSNDRQLIEQFTDQPSELPPTVRAVVEARLGAGSIRGYAMADLDDHFAFAESWLVLGDNEIYRAQRVNGGFVYAWIRRDAIKRVEIEQGLSCHVLRITTDGDGESGEVRGAEKGMSLLFTHRQRRAMEALSFVLEQAIEQRQIELGDPDQSYAAHVAHAIRTAQTLVVRRRITVVWRLLSYLKPYKRRVAGGMAAGVGITMLSLVPPYLTGHVIDQVIRPVQSGMISAGEVAHIAWLVVAGLAAVYVLRQVCLWLRLNLMAELGEFVARDLRTHLYDHMQKLSVSFFSRKKTGSLITRVSSDTDRLWEFLAFGVVEVSLAALMLIGLGAVLISLDLRLGLLMTLPVPLLCLAIHLHGERLNRIFLRAWRKWSRLTDLLSDTIPGVRVVKAFNQEAREKERFGGRNYDCTDEFNRIHALWTTFWPALMLSVQLMVILVWVLAIPRLLGGTSLGPTLSTGTFVSFLLYMTMFLQPVEVIGQVTRMMNRATSSAHRVFEILDTEPEVVDVAEPVKLDRVVGAVELENVTFSYDGVRQVLHNLSFQVKPGELIGLVGPSGSGKTTVINLLTRFYDVTGGRIRIDGVDLRQLDSGLYRQQVGMVLQDPYLFHGSVLDNIRYGMPDATLDQVVAAARTANAHDFIMKLPHAYDTLVGERGHTLSGGERQRVSIARAVLKNPRILILDEATSSVDTETERKIEEAMQRLVQGRTVFAIAHRLSTLRRASRLFVIKDGRLVEHGTHQELLALPGGTYRKLYELQQEMVHAA
jgi:ATP-binding cassette subfamily B protein